MHVAGRLAKALRLKPKDVELIEKAALLHDVGHGPFSHVSERLLAQYTRPKDKVGLEEIHEEITRLAIDTDKDLAKLLKGDKNEVLKLLSKSQVRSIQHDIISGPFDADKLDYLLRDSHYCGVRYGAFDLERIINTVTPINEGRTSYMGINEDGFWAVEQVLLAKHHMNLQVYRHRVKLIIEAMLVRAVEIAVRDGQEDVKHLYQYRAESEFVDTYLKWDDEAVMRALRESPSPQAKQYAERLLERRLLKVIYSKYIKDFKDVRNRNRIPRLAKPDLSKVEKEIALALKSKLDHAFSPDFVIVDIQSFSNPTFRPPGLDVFEGDIMVKKKDGTVDNATNYPNTILGTAKEQKQEMVYVYVPLDGMSSKERENLTSSVEGDISTILENI